MSTDGKVANKITYSGNQSIKIDLFDPRYHVEKTERTKYFKIPFFLLEYGLKRTVSIDIVETILDNSVQNCNPSFRYSLMTCLRVKPL